jgi:CRP-like cAMP-binding protein
VCLGILRQGALSGETQVLFDSDPAYSIECQSYCTIGVISREKFIEVTTSFPDIRQTMIDQVLGNPYDDEREQFVDICKQSISYLKNADKDTLRQLFYRAKQQFYDSKQVLFDVGDACENIYFVLHGVIDIVISDGYQNHQVLDILGKGSIIGANFVLKKEKWIY